MRRIFVSHDEKTENFSHSGHYEWQNDEGLSVGSAPGPICEEEPVDCGIGVGEHTLRNVWEKHKKDLCACSIKRMFKYGGEYDDVFFIDDNALIKGGVIYVNTKWGGIFPCIPKREALLILNKALERAKEEKDRKVILEAIGINSGITKVDRPIVGSIEDRFAGLSIEGQFKLMDSLSEVYERLIDKK